MPVAGQLGNSVEFLVIPKSITFDQYVIAANAFCEALGFSAKHVYYPMVLTEDAILLAVTPVRDGSADKQFPLHGNGFESLQEGDQYGAVLAVPVRIEVER